MWDDPPPPPQTTSKVPSWKVMFFFCRGTIYTHIHSPFSQFTKLKVDKNKFQKNLGNQKSQTTSREAPIRGHMAIKPLEIEISFEKKTFSSIPCPKVQLTKSGSGKIKEYWPHVMSHSGVHLPENHGSHQTSILHVKKNKPDKQFSSTRLLLSLFPHHNQ